MLHDHMTSTPDPAHTTVTGVFPNQQLASVAAGNLVSAGYRAEQVHVVHAGTPGRHEFIRERTADTRRAVMLGALFGAAGGALAGAVLWSAFGFVQAVAVGGLAAALGGAALGLLVGRSTKSQVQDELEHQVDSGTVLVSVTADSAHAAMLLELLAKDGGSSIVSSPTAFTAGVLPASAN